jgi:predicted kinase
MKHGEARSAKNFDWMFEPVYPELKDPPFDGQEVVATIGCPGSGKSTASLKLDPEKWITLTLDDFRTALWPPHRRVYWDVRAGDRGPQAQATLRNLYTNSICAGLDNGWNLFLADTHIKPSAFMHNVDVIRSYGLVVKWKLFRTPYEIIMERNKTRPIDHRLPENVLEDLYKEMWREDAWWKSIPKDQIEVVG